MQALNVLIMGEGNNVDGIKKSKYLKKLYSTTEIEGALRLTFNTFRELANQCKSLQIDLVIVQDENLIYQGIADVLRKNLINCIAIYSNWTNIINKSMLNQYGIDTPLTLKYPNTPLVVKSGNYCKIANSISEVVDIQHELLNTSAALAKNMYLEEFLTGNIYHINAIYDTKNLFTFPLPNLNEIQQLKLKEYSSLIQNMLTKEKVDFIGFINSKLIWHNNKWYNIGFSFEFPQTDIHTDILYILIAAIYQNLDALDLLK